MPNWCLNKVVISGSTEDVKAFKELVRGGSADERAFSFQTILPCPPELHIEATTEEEKFARAEKYDGYIDWYQWQVDHWGTKWSVNPEEVTFEDYDTDGGIWEFHTAWSPPEGIYQELASRFPDMNISWFYDEPGMQIAGYLNNPYNR